MPSSVVTMKPPGSRPGINSFAITPTTSPKIIHPRMPNMRTPPPHPDAERVPSVLGDGRLSWVEDRWSVWSLVGGRECTRVSTTDQVTGLTTIHDGQWPTIDRPSTIDPLPAAAEVAEPRIDDRVEDGSERVREPHLQTVLVATAEPAKP